MSTEPEHNKINKMTCAPSEDSHQPGHPPSLIRVFAGHTGHFVGFVVQRLNLFVLSCSSSYDVIQWLNFFHKNPYTCNKNKCHCLFKIRQKKYMCVSGFPTRPRFLP